MKQVLKQEQKLRFESVYSSVFSDMISATAEVCDEAVIQFDKDGVKLCQADNALVCVTGFSIPSKAFTTYEISAPMKVGVSLTTLKEVLKRVKTDRFSFEISGGKIVIRTASGYGNAPLRMMEVPIIEVLNDDIPPIGELKYDKTIDVEKSHFSDALKDALLYGDSLEIEAGGNKLVMRGQSDVGKCEVVVGLKEISTTEKAKTKFSLEYLQKMRFSGSIKLSLGTDVPARFEESGNNYEHYYVLAPRVAEGD